MTDRVDLFSSSISLGGKRDIGFARGEISTVECSRCRAEQLPWDLRSFGGKSICGSCYDATLEIARGAIKAMPAEGGRRCSACRAMRQPTLGSAWCAVSELGDQRARICANFVPDALASVRAEVGGGRVRAMDAWESTLGSLVASLGKANVEAWFGAIEPLDIHGDELVLAVPDEYTRQWAQEHLDAVVRAALSASGYGHLSPTYRVDTDPLPAAPALGISQRDPQFTQFNPHYSFAEFIVGSGNRLAHASALACVDQPGKVYNPLVLYGGVGVGKTHLLQAIGQEALEQGMGRVLYATSETFTNDLIRAIRDGATGDFRERYRSVDFLLLDDVQFIAGKEATQEEFFHTFNALHQSGKQIVLTCDRPPRELRVLEDRLRSRFAWGMMADMQPPDIETRIAIARAKAGQRDRRVPETVLDTIAARAGANVRELEGALNLVMARADLLGTDASMEIVHDVLGDAPATGGGCRPDDVMRAVSAYFHMRASDLAGPQRDRPTAAARQIAMYLLREEAKMSLTEIGQYLGGRNHSTVIYGCDKIANEMKRKSRVRQDVQAIGQLIYGVR